MQLKKQEREFFQKLLENFFVKNPHFKQCQVTRLLPFIHKHHSGSNFQFVHDLTGAHFSIERIALMKVNLPFLNNNTNPQMFHKLDQ